MINVKFFKCLSTTFYGNDAISFLDLRFENDVKMYGTQTNGNKRHSSYRFENDVKIYGIEEMVYEDRKSK